MKQSVIGSIIDAVLYISELVENTPLAPLTRGETRSVSLIRGAGGCKIHNAVSHLYHRPVILLISGLSMFFSACEDEITPTLEEVDPVLVVDAWVTDTPERQLVRLTQTQPYFDTLVSDVVGATVQIQDSQGKTYDFAEDERQPGAYYWNPTATEPTFGTVGETYQLRVTADNQVYTSTSRMNPVPPIDSITYELLEATAFFPETYLAEFWSTDLPEVGNAYWVRAYKNGLRLNTPGDISVAYDAGFSRGGSFNGTVFAQPIRSGINPFRQDEDGDFLPAYEVGDSVYVELYSISDAAFDFLSQVSIQTNRPGGFAELFSNPIANVSTNIVNTDAQGPAAVGYFNVASVSGLGTRIE